MKPGQEGSVDKEKSMLLVVHHPKSPGASLERLRRAMGTIPYRGPVILLTLWEPAEPDVPPQK